MCLFLVCGTGWSVWFCSQRLGLNRCPRDSGLAGLQEVWRGGEDHEDLVWCVSAHSSREIGRDVHMCDDREIGSPHVPEELARGC